MLQDDLQVMGRMFAAEEQGGALRGEFAAHAPTADRVMRVFMGSPIPSDESSSPEDEGGNDDDMDIEEIDFNDLSRLMDIDTKKKSKKAKAKLWMEQGAEEESFLGMRATPAPQTAAAEGVDESKIVESVMASTSMTAMTVTASILPATAPITAAGGDRDQEKIILAVDEMHIDGRIEEARVEAHQAAEEEVALDFIIDTEPVHVHTHEKPRIRTPPLIPPDDDDDEVIVYVAPHPRSSEVEGIAKAQTAKEADDQQHIHTIRGCSREPKRLAAPALSTPRMVKQALVKQKKVAKREKDAERRRKARSSPQGMFDKKRKGRGGFGAIGAMMQERELQDEYGSGDEDEGVDKKWKERRRGDSDLEWGTDDEDVQRQVAGLKGKADDDEYMSLPELQQVLMESGKAGAADGGEDGRGEFTPYTPPASSKRRDRRRKSGANANAGSAAQRRKDESIAAAMEMDVDSDLDVEAMKRFCWEYAGEDAGVHVTFGDLEDEQRLRRKMQILGKEAAGIQKAKKIRESERKKKEIAKTMGKGKAKMDWDEDEFEDDMDFDDDDDDDDDDYFKKDIRWSIEEIQEILDDDSAERRPNAMQSPVLRAQWDKDREAKAERKKQRELEKLLQAADLFSTKKGGKKGRKAMLAVARLDPTITVVPNRIIDMTTLVQMLHKFVDDLGGKQTLSLRQRTRRHGRTCTSWRWRSG
ncbi:hypothetical protein FA13DRAFT_1802032 [Coprinellus micaceus]|uniref:Uncharacterized protein n=1 Tax=Coprinellus micaceus TaxID=71717 RepID=A0A4Y7SDN5_COPMI|nr:hypothetical protein FA13DRAFT_1802032 [Coprinellus micaceus]